MQKMQRKEICEYLKNNFKLHTREAYRECNLSDSTKQILCDISLPNEALNLIQFDINKENIIFDKEHIIIGHDFGTYICINNKEEIVSIDSQNEYPIRFINKNLESFLEFIITFLLYEDKMKSEDDNQIDQAVQEIRKRFDIIDIHALSDKENWWSLILEQYEI